MFLPCEPSFNWMQRHWLNFLLNAAHKGKCEVGKIRNSCRYLSKHLEILIFAEVH